MDFSSMGRMLSRLKGVGTMVEQLKELKVTGIAGGGLVKVVVNGQMQCSSIEYDEALVTKMLSDGAGGIKPASKRVLEDLTKTAFNDAMQQVMAQSQNTLMNMMKMPMDNEQLK